VVRQCPREQLKKIGAMPILNLGRRGMLGVLH
jgi:hypothetical protein